MAKESLIQMTIMSVRLDQMAQLEHFSQDPCSESEMRDMLSQPFLKKSFCLRILAFAYL